MSEPTPPQDTPIEETIAADTSGRSQRDDAFARVEKRLMLRAGIAVLLYVAFVILDISAALTHTIEARGPILLGLLIGAILLLPRQIIPQSLLTEADNTPRTRAFVDRLKRIQIWLVWVRAIFFFGALLLFVVLPRLLD